LEELRAAEVLFEQTGEALRFRPVRVRILSVDEADKRREKIDKLRADRKRIVATKVSADS
jgi:hypothetical protein